MYEYEESQLLSLTFNLAAMLSSLVDLVKELLLFCLFLVASTSDCFLLLRTVPARLRLNLDAGTAGSLGLVLGEGATYERPDEGVGVVIIG